MTEEKTVKKAKPKNKIKDVALSSSKRVRCYYCGKDIKLKRDLAVVEIPLVKSDGKIKDVPRKVHIACATEYMDRIEHEEETLIENSEWDKCYEAFKKTLGVNEGQKLEKHAVMRLLGLRNGKYYPQGENVRNLKRGYSFEEIRMTILYCSPKIKQALSKGYGFKNGDHKINYIMAIIVSDINFISQKMNRQKEVSDHLKSAPDEQTDIHDIKPFINGGGKKKVEVAQGKMEEDIQNDKNEIDDIESLFN